MKTLTIGKDIPEATVIDEIRKSELFSSLSDKDISQISKVAALNQYEPQEIIMQVGAPSDACFLIVNGEVAIVKHFQDGNESMELGRRNAYDMIGAMGLLLGQPRSATVQAVEETLLVTFVKSVFDYLFEKVPGFGQCLSRSFASRLRELSISSILPTHDKDAELPLPGVIRMLPMDFIVRHGILPLRDEGNFLHVGFVHDPNVSDLRAVQRLLPGVQLKLAHITKELFDKVLQSQAGVEEWTAPEKTPQETEQAVTRKAPRLNRLLKRMVAEGASDLHLSAGRAPCWRIDGEIRTIQDAKTLEGEEVLNILNPVMEDLDRQDFQQSYDTDFAYGVPNVARFRINLFRDHRGVGAVIRVIPSTVLSIEQLGLPPVLKTLSEKPKGLVLVTGSTGSGKSTTLAAMIDHINKTRRVHVITVEDPIEFVHQEDLALINQRQVGHHTKSFASAIRAALREDPDILLIGELRDRETIALSLEAAHTGSLVFGTLQTATAISTMTHIIDFFPPDQQDHVRSSLADSLQGVVSQTLCRRIGGGRVLAPEVLIVDTAVRHLILEEKTNQIVSTMQTKRGQGNTLLNEELAELVKGRRLGKARYKVEYEEALSKTSDREDLARRLGRPLPKD